MDPNDPFFQLQVLQNPGLAPQLDMMGVPLPQGVVLNPSQGPSLGSMITTGSGPAAAAAPQAAATTAQPNTSMALAGMQGMTKLQPQFQPPMNQTQKAPEAQAAAQHATAVQALLAALLQGHQQGPQIPNFGQAILRG